MLAIATPPDAALSLSGTKVLLDATGSTAAAGGALSASISPSTGVAQVAPGLSLVPKPPTPTTNTVSVTEAESGLTDTAQIVVASAAAGVVALTKSIGSSGPDPTHTRPS